MTKPMVVKVGGALLEEKQHALHFFSVLKRIQETQPVIVIHGGGNSVANLLNALGFQSEKIDGLRVTPKEQLPYVVGALAGTVNKTLCSWALQSGLTPVGLSLLDGAMCQSELLNEHLGFVGKAVPNQPELLNHLLHMNQLPIISSIGASATGDLLNINADDAAAAIAALVQGQLVLLSDVPCVLDAKKAPIHSLNKSQIHQLIQDNVIEGGMAVKVNAALNTANTLQAEVCIASWKTPEQLIALSEGKTCGTHIVPCAPEHSHRAQS